MTSQWHQAGWIGLGIMTALGMTACGDDTQYSGDNNGGGNIQVQNAADLQEAVARAFCDSNRDANCATDPFTRLLIDMARDTGDCPGALIELGFSDLAELEDAVERGTVTFDADAANECINAIRTECLGGPENSACDRTFLGTLSEGDSCTLRDECQAGTFCDLASGDLCEQTCKPVLQIGDDCFADSECGGALNPDIICSDNGTCAEVTRQTGAQEGEECGEFDGLTRVITCANDLFCQRENFSDEGVCTVPKAEGEACGDFGACEGELICADGVCRPLQIRQNGQSCSVGDLGSSDALELCNTLEGLTCNAGTCEVAPGGGDGQECRGGNRNDLFLRECDEGLVCDFENDVCGAPRADGQSCFSDDECASGICGFDSGLCEEAPMCQ